MLDQFPKPAIKQNSPGKGQGAKLSGCQMGTRQLAYAAVWASQKAEAIALLGESGLPLSFPRTHLYMLINQ